MNNQILSGDDFSLLLQNGYEALLKNAEIINDLNIFPVPDGDTGTNMKLTFAGGLHSIKKGSDLASVASDFARGCLFAARGNSGVLSSQYFKGIASGLANKKSATVEEFAQAMVTGHQTAYKAAADAVEGTILTVAREGIENVIGKPQNFVDFPTFFSAIIEAMKRSLDNTPNLLPVLKEAGVIDSGGKGLLTIFQGFLSAYTGKEETSSRSPFEEHSLTNNATPIDFSAFNEKSTLDYGYCTEFLLQLLEERVSIEDFSVNSFISWLKKHGDSIVCFQTGSIVKVHIHTKKPYEVIRYAERFGEFLTFKMENMSLQHNEVMLKEEKKNKERVPSAIVAIGQGEGIKETFRSLGADIVLDGGKTMNAPTEEIIDAANRANADDVILLPNESNILLSAKQAEKLYKKCKIHVVPTNTLMEGYVALSMLMDKNDIEGTLSAFNEAKESVETGFVALSNRKVNLHGLEVTPHHYIGGISKNITATGSSPEETLIHLIEGIADIDTKSAAIIFKGKNMSDDASQKMVDILKEKFPNLEVGLLDGGQEVYDYLLGIY